MMKQQGRYIKYSPSERVEIGKYYDIACNATTMLNEKQTHKMFYMASVLL